MYEAFFGLTSKPFQLNPDPAFYFGSKQHRRARAYLEYGVMRGEGFIVITGEVGAGKTTVVRGLLEGLDPKTVVAAQLVSTQIEAEDTLRLVAAAFGVNVRDVSKAELLMALEAFFLRQATLGKRCLLLVDEAQNLTSKAVEELRMLSNFQLDKKALLQTFLVGQPEFRHTLQSPDMLQLRQRVIARCHLGPMEQDETRGYIEHRLRCAGATDKPTFEDGVFEAIHDYTHGVPRRINTLCDRLLLSAFLAGTSHITKEFLANVLAELDTEQSVPAPTPKVITQQSSPGLMTLEVPEGAELKGGLLPDLQEHMGRLTAVQLSAQLSRIERSVLRQERLNIEILTALQKILEKR